MTTNSKSKSTVKLAGTKNHNLPIKMLIGAQMLFVAFGALVCVGAMYLVLSLLVKIGGAGQII